MVYGSIDVVAQGRIGRPGRVERAALDDGRHAVGVDLNLAGEPLVNAAQVDDQDAVDEHEHVVVAVELQAEARR